MHMIRPVTRRNKQPSGNKAIIQYMSTCLNALKLLQNQLEIKKIRAINY